MKLLSFLHVAAMFIPSNLFLLNQVLDVATPRPILMSSILIQYIIPLTWSLEW